MILRESQGTLSTVAFREYLLQRDARLNLEYDIAWANQFIIDHLLHLFPASKFIILIRDSYTWLQSVIGHLVSRDVPSDVLAFLKWWFKPERYPHSRHDRALAEQGLFFGCGLLTCLEPATSTSVPSQFQQIGSLY